MGRVASLPSAKTSAWTPRRGGAGEPATARHRRPGPDPAARRGAYMTKRMLIDAAHAEETRVAVVDGGKIEELDFEIASKRQLRGNIYLAKVVRQLGGDAMEEIPSRAYRSRKQYKIQEVIKRRQVLLVQVVKEERGNKGAALTTYLSLAGRYCVLMPNTARGGGISRKITNSADRKRLKSATSSLDVPHGMGLIVRTAGASRTKAEIKRDYDYLLRMWENIRETTLQSIAPP